MNNTNIKTTLLSLSTAVLLGMTGCSNSSNNNDTELPTDTTGNTISDVTTLTGVGIDGYLSQATVCLDLSNDGYCQIGVEPASFTDTNGTFSLTLTEEQKSAYPNYKDAPILIYSGFDVDTGVEFIGKIKAPYIEGKAINVSPISTMVHSLIKDANKTQEEAESAVRTMLELPSDADLSLDPIAEAKKDATLLKAALKLQKTIEVLAKAKETAGASSNTKEIVEELYKTLATVASNSDTNLTIAVQNIVESDTDLDDNITDSTKALISQIDTIIGENVNTTALVGTKISAMQNEIEDAIQNNAELPTTEVLNTIVNSDFSLLHAQELLRMLEISDINATDVQAVLQDAGMTKDEFLSVEEEIEALKANSKTALVGLKLEDFMTTGFEAKKDLLELEAEANAKVEASQEKITELKLQLQTANETEQEQIQEQIKTEEEKIANSEKQLIIKEATIELESATRIETEAEHALEDGLIDADELEVIKTETEDANSTLTEIVGINYTAVKSDINTLLDSPSNVATVNDAKNMFTQIRETTLTFVDLENSDTNTSTVVGSQIDTIENKIQPQTEAIISDFENSVTAMDDSLNAFNTSIEDDFNATMNLISDRVEALTKQTENFTYDQNWTVTAGEDSLSHTYEVSNGTETHIYTFNGTSFTSMGTRDSNNDFTPTSIVSSGLVPFTGTNYTLDVTALSFDGSKCTLVAKGQIIGDNSAVMDLTTLDLTLDANTSIDNFNMFQNIELALKGSITAGGRTLVGSLALHENAMSVLTGSYTGLSNEPSFEGKVTLTGSINSLINDAANNHDSYVNVWSPLVMVYVNGTESLATSMVQENSTWGEIRDENETVVSFYNSYEYNITTQSGLSVICDINRTNNINEIYDPVDNATYYQTRSLNNSVTCSDNAKLIPYYTTEDKITAQVNGKEMVVDDAWSMGVYDGQHWINKTSIYFANEGQTYYDTNGDLSLNGEPITISDIQVLANKDLLDRTFDVKFVGTLIDGNKKIVATLGIDRGVESKIYAQDIEITDGESFVRVEELSAVLENSEFLKQVNAKNEEDPFYYYGDNKSEFENYFIDYTNNTNESNNDLDPKNVLSATIDNLELSIVDTDGDLLTLRADMSLENRDAQFLNFDGSYTYKATEFVGHLDANGTVTERKDGTSEVIGTANLYGSIQANGFVPFDITATAESRANDAYDVYSLFTRGSDYQLALHLTQEANGGTQTLKIADSNGVLGNATIEEDKTFLFNVTNKNGDNLATYGEDNTGNEWEIKYSDNTSETLF